MGKKRARVITGILLALLIATIGLKVANDESLKITESINITTESHNAGFEYVDALELLVIANYNNQVIGYKGEKEAWRVQLDGVASGFAFDSMNNHMYVGSEDGNVYRVDMTKGVIDQTMAIGYRVYSIDIDENNEVLLISAGSSMIKHKLYLMDLEGGQIWKDEVGIRSKSAVFDPDLNRILVGNSRGEILIYDYAGQRTGKAKLDYKVEKLKIDDDIITILTTDEVVVKLDQELNVMNEIEVDGTELSEATTLSTQGEGLTAVGDDSGKLVFIDHQNREIYAVDLGSRIMMVKSYLDQTLIVSLEGNIMQIDNERLLNVSRNTALKGWTDLALQIILFAFVMSLFFSIQRLQAFVTGLAKVLFKHRTAYLMLLPTFVLVTLFAYTPIFTAVTRAFTDWNMFTDEINFNGLDNFAKMLDEGYFLAGIKNLGIMIAFNLLKFLTMPFLAAELVYHLRSSRGKYMSRLLFVVPMIVPMVVTSLMWQNIYDPNIGLLNQLLEVAGLEHLQQVWLGNEKTALGAIIFMGFPFIDAFAFLVYYGGLLAIPGELFEAAKIDGSNGFWNLLYIHIPMISPQFKIIIMLQFISTIQNFAPILILTSGGPGTSTYVPGLELYFNATVFGNYGYACALGLVMFIAIAFVTYLNSKIKTTIED